MNILFMCVANSARSQMAEGIAKSILGNKHNIQSAGSEPSGVVHPNAVLALSEINLDATNHYSKSIDQLDSSFEKDFIVNEKLKIIEIFEKRRRSYEQKF